MNRVREFPAALVKSAAEFKAKIFQLDLTERVNTEIKRLSKLFVEHLEQAKNKPASQQYWLIFEIAPDEQRGHGDIKQIVSEKLAKQFPGMIEYHVVVRHADIDKWCKLEKKGAQSFEYRIRFDRK
jgi:hypothetical protein